MRYRARFVVADFDEITTDFGAVVNRLNRHFGTAYGEFEHNPENVERCLALMKQRSKLPRLLLSFESGTATLDEALSALANLPESSVDAPDAWVPSAARTQAKTTIQERWADPRLDGARLRATSAYERFLQPAVAN